MPRKDWKSNRYPTQCTCKSPISLQCVTRQHILQHHISTYLRLWPDQSLLIVVLCNSYYAEDILNTILHFVAIGIYSMNVFLSQHDCSSEVYSATFQDFLSDKETNTDFFHKTIFISKGSLPFASVLSLSSSSCTAFLSLSIPTYIERQWPLSKQQLCKSHECCCTCTHMKFLPGERLVHDLVLDNSFTITLAWCSRHCCSMH